MITLSTKLPGSIEGETTANFFLSNLWFNLTAFWMIAGTVFTYQTFRHSKAKRDLSLNETSEEFSNPTTEKES
jgi:hypothetical protein